MMKKIIIKGSLVYIILFAVLFISRTLYGLFTYNQENQYYWGSVSTSYLYNNVASDVVNVRIDETTKAGLIHEQKYEKTAVINSLSESFDEDIDEIRQIIEFYGALIQSENLIENLDYKNTEFVIGVHPNMFESIIEKLKDSIPVNYLNITKTDKTEEYENLINSRTSLEKTMNSLIELKLQKGSIDEFINLEYKILELDKEIQLLKNSTGKYESEKSLCTIVISIRENRLDIAYIITDSFYWALTVSVSIVILILLVSASAFLFITVYNKIKKKS
jgi:uncharacterized protein YfcZ (UPF0381/DUF406 family)